MIKKHSNFVFYNFVLWIECEIQIQTKEIIFYKFFIIFVIIIIIRIMIKLRNSIDNNYHLLIATKLSNRNWIN